MNPRLPLLMRDRPDPVLDTDPPTMPPEQPSPPTGPTPVPPEHPHAPPPPGARAVI